MNKEQQDLSQLVRNFEESRKKELVDRRKAVVDSIEKRKRRGKVMSIKVPELGNFKKCKVTKWHFQIGDIVTTNDVICDIAYDKATLELGSENNSRIISAQKIDAILSPGKELCKIERF